MLGTLWIKAAQADKPFSFKLGDELCGTVSVCQIAHK